MKNYILAIVVVLTIVLFSFDVDAQCAMCKAIVESEYESNGAGIGGGINRGILYLMGIPYVLIAIMIFFYFRKKRQAL